MIFCILNNSEIEWVENSGWFKHHFSLCLENKDLCTEGG